MPTPNNSNFLSILGFKLSIEKIPEVTYNCQTVELPSLSMGYAEQSTPMIQMPVLGDKIQFGDFVIDFIINEDMTDYKKLWEWIVGIGHPESLDQYSSFHQAEARRLFARYNPKNHNVMYSDASLEILTNNYTPNNVVRFVDLFPIGLSAVPFQTTSEDVQYLTARATFKYTGFSFD